MNKYAQNIMDAVMDWLQDDEEETIQTILYLYKTTTDTALKSTIFDILTDCDRCIDCGTKLQWQEVETDPYDGDATTGFWYCPQCDEKYKEDVLNEEANKRN